MSFRFLTSFTVRWLVAGAAAVVWAGSGSAMGCSDGPQAFNPAGSTTGSGGAGGGVNAARRLFDELAPEFLDECGTCHAIGGPADTPFVGDIDGTKPAAEFTQKDIDKAYEAITAWPRFIVKDPTKSTLVTWGTSTQHGGGPMAPALEVLVRAWLTAEAEYVKDVGTEPIPTIPPFKPVVPGFNAVYLDALGPEYLGMAVTFQAEELTDQSLSLTNLEVHPTAKKGLSFEHPLFTVFPVGSSEGDPDPVDSFSNVVTDFQPGESGALGPGTLVLTNWQKGGKLSIAFETISVIDPTAMGGAGGGMGGGACSALMSFESNAAPQLSNCVGCHGGNNAGATNAVDMTQLSSDPDSACGQIRNRIDLNNPGNSQLFVTTDPSVQNTHPFKFGGNTANFNAFKTAVTTWIQQEAQ